MSKKKINKKSPIELVTQSEVFYLFFISRRVSNLKEKNKSF